MEQILNSEFYHFLLAAEDVPNNYRDFLVYVKVFFHRLYGIAYTV